MPLSVFFLCLLLYVFFVAFGISHVNRAQKKYEDEMRKKFDIKKE